MFSAPGAAPQINERIVADILRPEISIHPADIDQLVLHQEIDDLPAQAGAEPVQGQVDQVLQQPNDALHD